MIDFEMAGRAARRPGAPSRWSVLKPLCFLPLLAVLLGVPAALRAQEYRGKFASPQHRKVVLDMRGSDVTVEGYDGDELVVHSTGGYEAPPALANGLRAVYNAAEDNTRLGLAIVPGPDNTIRITRASRSDGHYTVRLPRRTDVVFSQTGWGGSDDLVIRDIAGRVEASLKSGDLRLLNVSGPVVANTVSGDIKVVFSAVPDGPSAVSTVSGNVDVTLPAATKATFSLRSVSGEIYTDFDLGFGGPDGLRRVGGLTVQGHSNGGGATMSLKTVSGDIYVRKAK